MKSEDKELFRLDESQPSTLTPVSAMNAVQYNWGEQCKAWFLLKNPELTVIEEEMPPGSSEMRHFHYKAQQLFYILREEATMEIGDKSIDLRLPNRFTSRREIIIAFEIPDRAHCSSSLSPNPTVMVTRCR
jgi:hypothetical protein